VVTVAADTDDCPLVVGVGPEEASLDRGDGLARVRKHRSSPVLGRSRSSVTGVT
jgi:hypothetical protein